MQAPWAGGHIGEGGFKGPNEGTAGGGEPEEPTEPVNPLYRTYRYYSSNTKSKPTAAIMEKLHSKFSKRMEKMKTLFEKMTKPDGSHEYPARTCRDLFAFHPTLKSGKFSVYRLYHCMFGRISDCFKTLLVIVRYLLFYIIVVISAITCVCVWRWLWWLWWQWWGWWGWLVVIGGDCVYDNYDNDCGGGEW